MKRSPKSIARTSLNPVLISNPEILIHVNQEMIQEVRLPTVTAAPMLSGIRFPYAAFPFLDPDFPIDTIGHVTSCEAFWKLHYVLAIMCTSVPVGHWEALKCVSVPGALGGGSAQTVGSDGGDGYAEGASRISAPMVGKGSNFICVLWRDQFDSVIRLPRFKLQQGSQYE